MSVAVQKNQLLSDSEPSNSSLGVVLRAANFREGRAACIYVKAAYYQGPIGAIEFFSNSNCNDNIDVPFSAIEAINITTNFIISNSSILGDCIKLPVKPLAARIERFLATRYKIIVAKAQQAFLEMKMPHPQIWVVDNLPPGSIAIINKPPLFIIAQESDKKGVSSIYGIFFNSKLFEKLRLTEPLLQVVKEGLVDYGYNKEVALRIVKNETPPPERAASKVSRPKKEEAKLNRVYNEKPKQSAFVTELEFKRATFPKVAPDTKMIEKPKFTSNSIASIPIASPSPVSSTTPLAGSSQGEPTQNSDLPAWLKVAPQSVVNSYLEAKKNGQVL